VVGRPVVQDVPKATVRRPEIPAAVRILAKAEPIVEKSHYFELPVKFGGRPIRISHDNQRSKNFRDARSNPAEGKRVARTRNPEP
jgi:hypothetical protein